MKSTTVMAERTPQDKEHAQFEAQRRAMDNRREALASTNNGGHNYSERRPSIPVRRASMPTQNQYKTEGDTNFKSHEPSSTASPPRVQFTPSIDERENMRWQQSLEGLESKLLKKKLKKSHASIVQEHKTTDDAQGAQGYSWASKLRFASTHSGQRVDKDARNRSVSIVAASWLEKRPYSSMLTSRQLESAPDQRATSKPSHHRSRSYTRIRPRTASSSRGQPETGPLFLQPVAQGQPPQFLPQPPTTTYPSLAPVQAQSSQPIIYRTLSAESAAPYLSQCPYQHPQPQFGQPTHLHHEQHTSRHHHQYNHNESQSHIPRNHDIRHKHNPIPPLPAQITYLPEPTDPYWRIVPANPPGPKLELQQIVAAASTTQHSAPAETRFGAPAPKLASNAKSEMDAVKQGIRALNLQPLGAVITAVKSETRPPRADSGHASPAKEGVAGHGTGGGMTTARNTGGSGEKSDTHINGGDGSMDARKGTRDAQGRPWGPKWDASRGCVRWGYW